MKNTKKPRLGAFERIFSAVSALCIVSLSAYLAYYGALAFAFAVVFMGFLIRWFILLCMYQDAEAQQQEARENEDFFY